jgi:hypothetical protein
MSVLRLNKALGYINSIKDTSQSICTEAEVEIGEGVVDLKVNGTPSVVSISYNGTALFSSLMPLFFKVSIGSNKIIINNIFRKEIPETLLSYDGNITVTHCLIISKDSSKISATIKNNQNLLLLNKSETNLEDNDEIFIEELPELRKRLTSSGMARRKINSSYTIGGSKASVYSKKESESVSTLIKEISTSQSVHKKITADKITASKQALNLNKAKSVQKISEENKIRYGDVQGNIKKYRK